MIRHIVIEDGYEFYFNHKFVAIGTYTDKGFELTDINDIISYHNNGMKAMTFLRNKLEPESTKEFRPPLSVKASGKEVFKAHPALVGVSPSPMVKHNGY